MVGQAVFVQRTRAGGLRVLRGDTGRVEHRRPVFPHEGMTGDLPPVQPGPSPQGPDPSRSGRLRLTGSQVERRSLEPYAAMGDA